MWQAQWLVGSLSPCARQQSYISYVAQIHTRKCAAPEDVAADTCN
jgi:hypothetical protein